MHVVSNTSIKVKFLKLASPLISVYANYKLFEYNNKLMKKMETLCQETTIELSPSSPASE